MALRSGYTLFAQLPKGHALAHIYMFLELSKRRGEQLALNPGTWDCSMSEDFVGAIARQSRRVCYRSVTFNTVHAYLVQARFVMKRFKQNR